MEGLPAARGRPDHQNRGFPVGQKIIYQNPRCSYISGPACRDPPEAPPQTGGGPLGLSGRRPAVARDPQTGYYLKAGPRGPLNGPRGPLKGPRGPSNGSPGSFKRAPGSFKRAPGTRRNLGGYRWGGSARFSEDFRPKPTPGTPLDRRGPARNINLHQKSAPETGRA